MRSHGAPFRPPDHTCGNHRRASLGRLWSLARRNGQWWTCQKAAGRLVQCSRRRRSCALCAQTWTWRVRSWHGSRASDGGPPQVCGAAALGQRRSLDPFGSRWKPEVVNSATRERRWGSRVRGSIHQRCRTRRSPAAIGAKRRGRREPAGICVRLPAASAVARPFRADSSGDLWALLGTAQGEWKYEAWKVAARRPNDLRQVSHGDESGRLSAALWGQTGAAAINQHDHPAMDRYLSWTHPATWCWSACHSRCLAHRRSGLGQRNRRRVFRPA